jgi:gamma-glutamyltranspeptidase/glutathione hydrolase/leukotriene-C4 hydrolase
MFASGIGGGGFVLIKPNQQPAVAYDFREVAPRNIKESLFMNNSELAQHSGLAVGVPGEIAGLAQAHKDFGRLPWTQLVLPIVNLNREGFLVTPTLAKKIKSHQEWILKDPRWCALFVKEDGSLKQEGDIVKRPALADTLEEIARNGPAQFYQGRIAESIADEVKLKGGLLDLQDLQEYHVINRPVPVISYKGRKVYSVPAPASGNVLQYMLNILEGFTETKDKDVALSYHRLVEALRFGFARRSELGDPAFVSISIMANT